MQLIHITLVTAFFLLSVARFVFFCRVCTHVLLLFYRFYAVWIVFAIGTTACIWYLERDCRSSTTHLFLIRKGSRSFHSLRAGNFQVLACLQMLLACRLDRSFVDVSSGLYIPASLVYSILQLIRCYRQFSFSSFSTS